MSTATVRQGSAVKVEGLRVSAYTVPTDQPESDGTAEWDSTTIVVVEVRAAGVTGLGYTYAPVAAGKLVEEKLVELVQGRDAFATGEAWEAMAVALRNAGRPGIGFCALSAVDLALWDLKAWLLELPLVGLVGRARESAPVYGSGGLPPDPPERGPEPPSGLGREGHPRREMKGLRVARARS